MIVPKRIIQNIVRVQESGPSRFGKVRLDRSERTHPFSELFIGKVRERITWETLSTYPEPEPVYRKFASFLKQPRERLLFHTGSDLCIRSVFETYISPGDKVLLHRPGYAMFSVYARMFGVDAIYQEFDSDLRFDYAKYIDTIDGSFRMAVIENPNGFIGTAPPKHMLYKFIDKCETEGVIAVVDEAYFFFHEVTAADILDTHKNLIIIRTFSKAFGLAGARAGYILSCAENIKDLYRVKPMHELTGFSTLVIDELLDNEQEFRDFIKESAESLKFFKEGFATLGIETSDSVGNFLAARIGRYVTVSDLVARLQGENILLRRPFSEPHLQEWVRIGTAPLHCEQRVLDVVKEMMDL
jgi:histidinol-phosphate aminotransferase